MPEPRETAGEEVLPGYLEAARELLTARSEPADGHGPGLPDEVERLRWFLLPDSCVIVDAGAATGKPGRDGETA